MTPEERRAVPTWGEERWAEGEGSGAPEWREAGRTGCGEEEKGGTRGRRSAGGQAESRAKGEQDPPVQEKVGEGKNPKG